MRSPTVRRRQSPGIQHGYLIVQTSCLGMFSERKGGIVETLLRKKEEWRTEPAIREITVQSYSWRGDSSHFHCAPQSQ
jgi:hypothetical protein